MKNEKYHKMSRFGVIGKFLHWGPLTALGIIKCVTIVTLYMNSMWWPTNFSLGGKINQSLFLLLSSLATFNYIMATITGPGFLPKRWKPQKPEDVEHLQYCTECEGYKAPRSHHCRKCDRCVLKMDHHCPWINGCVGWSNHAYFTAFLAFAVLGSIQAATILILSFYQGLHRNYYLYHGYPPSATVQFSVTSLILCIFSLGLAVGVIIAVGMLLYFQIRAILYNRTGIEDWILQKAVYLRANKDEDFIYPYDLGKWNNIQEVISWSCAPIGDGITWKVRDGCDQYTLTREQLAQKAVKRSITRKYRIMRRATGSWLPLFSQGFRVCCSPPWSDEKRLKLEPGDTVLVTRWRKHWLFGEKCMADISNGTDENKKKHWKKSEIRGWLPRRCAVEIIENDEYASDNEKEKDL
ncbi:palmitoyltransferase ZDHHC6 [Condylostylus longicornis]|uniref:palmitoyltransferase ZDHHC6 n=1 Tax=Condylostylus longicornis TaxID=2530218 RepID=UPI00244DFB53|nr:palmitoyltransferase ZDHHC6 [Condylostylus longicornis]